MTGNEEEERLDDTIEPHIRQLFVRFGVEEGRRMTMMMSRPAYCYLPHRCDIFLCEWRAYASALLSHFDIRGAAFYPPPTPPHSLLASQLCKSRLLVLVDMNGTTILRTQAPIPDIAPCFTIRLKGQNMYYYMRPYAFEMLQALRQHPRCEVAFFTSMRKCNAVPAMHALGMENLDLYDRKFNVWDPMGENDYDTMRDLEKVWSTGSRVGSNYTADTTILIDNTFRKVRFYPDNAILVREYTEQDVRNGEDRDLIDLSTFLLNMLDACGYSVPSFLQAHPFKRNHTRGSGFIKGLWALLHSGPLAGRLGDVHFVNKWQILYVDRLTDYMMCLSILGAHMSCTKYLKFMRHYSFRSYIG